MSEGRKGEGRRKYTYGDETFYVTFGDCEIIVTDEEHTVRIAPQSLESINPVFSVNEINGTWGTVSGSPAEAVNTACAGLIKLREDKPDHCDNLRKFFEDLDID